MKQNQDQNTKLQTPADTMTLDRQLVEDFKNSSLIVSVLINLAVFVGWLTLILA